MSTHSKIHTHVAVPLFKKNHVLCVEPTTMTMRMSSVFNYRKSPIVHTHCDWCCLIRFPIQVLCVNVYTCACSGSSSSSIIITCDLMAHLLTVTKKQECEENENCKSIKSISRHRCIEQFFSFFLRKLLHNFNSLITRLIVITYICLWMNGWYKNYEII